MNKLTAKCAERGDKRDRGDRSKSRSLSRGRKPRYEDMRTEETMTDRTPTLGE